MLRVIYLRRNELRVIFIAVHYNILRPLGLITDEVQITSRSDILQVLLYVF